MIITKTGHNLIPEFYCALCVVLCRNESVEFFVDELKHLGIHSVTIHNPKTKRDIIVDIAIIRNEYSWNLDDVLTKLFSKINTSTQKLNSIIKKYNGHPYIDIAFYQHGTYPSLSFFGENMRTIHDLEADISIDPY